MNNLAISKLHAMVVLATMAITTNGLVTACYAQNQDEKRSDAVANSTVSNTDQDLSLVSPDPTDTVPVRRHRDAQWERNMQFDGARLVEAEYGWATYCYTPVTTCLLGNPTLQGSACWCPVPGGVSYGTAW